MTNRPFKPKLPANFITPNLVRMIPSLAEGIGFTESRPHCLNIFWLVHRERAAQIQHFRDNLGCCFSPMRFKFHAASGGFSVSVICPLRTSFETDARAFSSLTRR